MDDFLRDLVSIVKEPFKYHVNHNKGYLIDFSNTSNSVLVKSPGQFYAFRFDGVSKNCLINGKRYTVDTLFYLERIEGVHMMCDFITMFIYKDTLHVHLIELKSKNISRGIQQIRAGKIFVEHLIKTIKRYKGNAINLDNVMFKGIIFNTNNSYRSSSGKLLTIKDSISDLSYYKISYKDNYHPRTLV